MGTFSVWHWLIFLVIALLLFGGSGKISSIMGDVAKGIKSFKKGMTEEDDVATPAEGPKKLEGKAPEAQPMSSSASGSSTGTKVG
jgi:sec-independent protein translocase protein TatA